MSKTKPTRKETDLLSRDERILRKIDRIIEANLSNNEFSVNMLAREMSTSRIQLYRYLRKASKRNVSQYIREYRLQRAMELLKKDVGNISEISYMVGFGSPAYFIKCFHNFYGYPPGKEIKKNHEEPRSEKVGTGNTQRVPGKAQVGRSGKTIREKLPRYLLIIIAVGIVGVAVFHLAILQKKSNEPAGELDMLPPVSERSIAVFPFDNLSSDPENKYLAYGIADNIINQLTGISGIRTISRISSEYYLGSDLPLKNIGRELDVNYILNGSIQKDGDNILIVVQLLDITEDELIWSDDFDLVLEDMLKVERQIAERIVEDVIGVINAQDTP